MDQFEIAPKQIIVIQEMVKKGKDTKHRQNENDSKEVDSLLKQLEYSYSNEDLVHLARVMDSKTKDPAEIYPINHNYQEITRNLTGINLLFGSSFTGRKSSVYYGNRYERHPIIEIDANIYSTENQFIEKLVTEFSNQVGIQNFGKKLVIGDQITFHNMTRMIMYEKTKIIIMVENSQKLVEPKRQTILYNILEWVKDPTTKQYIAIYFITKSTRFTEDLEKRVKSRMTAKHYFYHNPDVESIIKIIKYKLASADVHYSLKELMIQCLQYPQTLKKMKQFFDVGKSIGFFLNWIKCTMCGLNPVQLRNNPDQHFYEVLHRSQQWMSPNVGLKLLLNATYPEIVFILTLSSLLRKECINLNLDEILKQHAKSKHDHLISLSTGSSFNYSDVVLERAFQKLIDMKILFIDDSMQIFRFAPITLALNRQEMVNEMARIEHLPEYIKKLIELA